MRLSIISLLLAAGIAVAADGPKPVTYLNGNIEGFAQNASGTLDVRSAKTMTLRTKGADVEIPYAAVSKTDRTTPLVSVAKDPLYKVWSLPQRLMPPTPLQQLVVTYKDKAGAEKSVTLEIQKATADRVLANVEQAAARNAANSGAWWGDSVWKTQRNKDQWGGSGAVAQRE